MKEGQLKDGSVQKYSCLKMHKRTPEHDIEVAP